MKNVEMVSKAIHEKIMSNFYSRMVNWYRVNELESEKMYEVKFYVNFLDVLVLNDEQGIKEFERVIEQLLKAIEDNALMKIDNNYHILVISDIDIIDNSILEITTICEKISKIN